RERTDLAGLVRRAEVDRHRGVLRAAERGEVQLREAERHLVPGGDARRQAALGDLLPGEVGADARVVPEVLDPQVAVDQAGVLARALREGGEVVAAGAQEREGRDRVVPGRV